MEYGLDDEWKGRLLLRNVPEKVLLEPIIDQLPAPERMTLLQAIEDDTYEEVAGEAIHSIGVE